MIDLKNCHAQKKITSSSASKPKVKAGLKLPAFWTVGLEAVKGSRELVSYTVVEATNGSYKAGNRAKDGVQLPPYKEDKNASIYHCLDSRYIPIKMRKSK